MRLLPLWIALAFLTVFYLLPIGRVLSLAVLDPGPTLRNLDRVIGSPAYGRVLWNTLRLGIEVTSACVLLGWPAALRIATLRPAWASAALSAIVATVWVSLLVRNYAWTVLLGREGLIPQALFAVGLVGARRSLLYSEGAVVVGMVHVLLPYMVLPILSSLRGIDRAVVRASESLGARPAQTLRRIVLPLSLPGVAAGSILVFLLCFGFFVTPAILGGPRQMTIAMIIDKEVNEMLAWGIAAALSLALVGFSLVLFGLYRSRFNLTGLAVEAP
jgi:ABC-type spermidine/putrescine transport system permease subunit I